jgi:hypothetical protein
MKAYMHRFTAVHSPTPPHSEMPPGIRQSAKPELGPQNDILSGVLSTFGQPRARQVSPKRRTRRSTATSAKGGALLGEDGPCLVIKRCTNPQILLHMRPVGHARDYNVTTNPGQGTRSLTQIGNVSAVHEQFRTAPIGSSNDQL